MDHYDFNVLGRWEVDRGPQQLAYDFWWHLGHDTLISSEWGTPNQIESGLSPEELLSSRYGHQLHVWNLRKRKHEQTIDLGKEYQMVLELRPSHDPILSLISWFQGCLPGSSMMWGGSRFFGGPGSILILFGRSPLWRLQWLLWFCRTREARKVTGMSGFSGFRWERRNRESSNVWRFFSLDHEEFPGRIAHRPFAISQPLIRLAR
jgi:hypothetical protein